MPELLLQYAPLVAAVTLLAKSSVDLVRTGLSLPPWGPPALAAAFGLGWAFILQLAIGTPFTSQLAAQCVIVGALAAFGAVGVTELARRADGTKA